MILAIAIVILRSRLCNVISDVCIALCKISKLKETPTFCLICLFVYPSALGEFPQYSTKAQAENILRLCQYKFTK